MNIFRTCNVNFHEGFLMYNDYVEKKKKKKKRPINKMNKHAYIHVPYLNYCITNTRTSYLFLERWIVEWWIVCKTRKVPWTKRENKFGFQDNLNYKVYYKKNPERLVKPIKNVPLKILFGKYLYVHYWYFMSSIS